MDRVPSFTMERPLDLSKDSQDLSKNSLDLSKNSSYPSFRLRYNFDLANADSRPLTTAASYSYNQHYSLAIVPPRLGDDQVDSSYNEPISSVSPSMEPESSTQPRKLKRSSSVGSTVDKSSSEYRRKRLKNNEAARKSRQKKKEAEVKIQTQVENLKKQNAFLLGTINNIREIMKRQGCTRCFCQLRDHVYLGE